MSHQRDRIILPGEVGSDITTELIYNEADDTITTSRVQDVEPYLDANKRAYNAATKGFESETFNQVASIPMILIEQWLREEGLDIFNPDHAGRLRRKLNDPDYLYLRTKPGRI